MKKKSAVERYASVFESKSERRARQRQEAKIEELVGVAEQVGCWCCDEPGNAHLHGNVLYLEGRALF